MYSQKLTEFIYRDHIWNVMSFENRGGYQIKILQRTFDELFAMLDMYSRVLVVRIDLPMPYYTDDSSKVTEFFTQLRLHVKARYKCKLGYIWAREINSSEQQHYHLGIMLNGHRINFPSKLIEKMEEIWRTITGKTPFTPKNCYRLIQRDNREEIQEVVHRLSYLSKNHTKNYPKKLSRSFGSSKLR